MSEKQRKIIIKSEYGEQEFDYEKPLLFYLHLYNRRLTLPGLDPIPFPPTAYLEIRIIEKENIEKLPKKEKEQKQYVYNEVGPYPIKERIRMHIPEQEHEITSTQDEEPPEKRPRMEHTISVQDEHRAMYNAIKNHLEEKYKHEFPLPYSARNMTAIKETLYDKISENHDKSWYGWRASKNAYDLTMMELSKSLSKSI